MSANRYLKQKNFETAKALISASVSYREVARIIGMSLATVANIRKCNTWADYLELRRVNAERYRASREKSTTTKSGLVLKEHTENPNKLSEFELRLLNQIVELTKIVENIEQHLVSKQVAETADRKGWFNR